MVSVEVGDNRAAREWLDMIAAKQIEVVSTGSGIGIEDGVALMLDARGWVHIDAGVTSVGVGAPGSRSRVDVLALDEVADETAAWLKSNLASIVVTRSPVGPERLLEGIVFVNTETRSIELIFDGRQWSIQELP